MTLLERIRAEARQERSVGWAVAPNFLEPIRSRPPDAERYLTWFSRRLSAKS